MINLIKLSIGQSKVNFVFHKSPLKAFPKRYRRDDFNTKRSTDHPYHFDIGSPHMDKKDI
jgi:hypothetical protein